MFRMDGYEVIKVIWKVEEGKNWYLLVVVLIVYVMLFDEVKCF